MNKDYKSLKDEISRLRGRLLEKLDSMTSMEAGKILDVKYQNIDKIKRLERSPKLETVIEWLEKLEKK